MARRLSFDERARIEAMRAAGVSVDETARPSSGYTWSLVAMVVLLVLTVPAALVLARGTGSAGVALARARVPQGAAVAS